MKYIINDIWHSGNTVRWNPEISHNTYSIEPGKVWVAQLIFFILARHIFGHHWPNFIPFIPPNLPKTLIFRVCILLDFRAISPHETRLYWPDDVVFETSSSIWDWPCFLISLYQLWIYAFFYNALQKLGINPLPQWPNSVQYIFPCSLKRSRV